MIAHSPEPSHRVARRVRARSLVLVLVLGAGSVLACKSKPDLSNAVRGPLANGVSKVTIEPAPDHLRGRVALPSGARIYARPSYASPSWELRLPAPPLTAADAPPRARAFRVIGVVRSVDTSIGGSLAAPIDFLAVTNDLDGDAEQPARGCGPRFSDLDHLRTLLYVSQVHLAQVTTRTLELTPRTAGDERVHVGAGVRVGEAAPTRGLPEPPAGSTWRWIDADGIRVLAPVPDDAVGVAWDPTDSPTLGPAGDPLVQDAEGSVLWLRDDGGDTVELTIRNDCGEHHKLVRDPGEVEGLRSLALDAFYDQAPPPEPEPVVQPDADYMIAAGTPLRWPDGELAGEVLYDWGVSVAIGQAWDDQRCFGLKLSGELPPVDDPAVVCVAPKALEPLTDAAGFSVSDELELGGYIEVGPAEILVGAWTDSGLRSILNSHHATVSECLRPMLVGDEPPEPTRWVLDLIVTGEGRVNQVEVIPLGPTHTAVEDCLRVEAFTWPLPDGGGQVLVPVTLGPWDESARDSIDIPDRDTRPERSGDEDRGKVIIIRDEESP